MSTTAENSTSGRDPSPNLVMPPDPLLQSGSFIDPTFAQKDHQRSADLPDFPRPSSASPGSQPPTSSTAESPVRQGRRRSLEQGATERPDWLPPGWVVEDRIRSSGASKGTVDRYYYHPGSRRRFRSKKEVLHFLDTGEVRKKRRRTDSSDVENPESSGHKQKNPALHFEFDRIPEEVEYIFTGSPEGGSWTAFIDDKEVPEQARDEWFDVFEAVTIGRPQLRF